MDDNLIKDEAIKECIARDSCSGCPYDADPIQCVAHWGTHDILDYCKFLKKITTKRILTSLIQMTKQSYGKTIGLKELRTIAQRLGVYEDK